MTTWDLSVENTVRRFIDDEIRTSGADIPERVYQAHLALICRDVQRAIEHGLEGVRRSLKENPL